MEFSSWSLSEETSVHTIPGERLTLALSSSWETEKQTGLEYRGCLETNGKVRCEPGPDVEIENVIENQLRITSGGYVYREEESVGLRRECFCLGYSSEVGLVEPEAFDTKDYGTISALIRGRGLEYSGRNTDTTELWTVGSSTFAFVLKLRYQLSSRCRTPDNEDLTVIVRSAEGDWFFHLGRKLEDGEFDENCSAEEAWYNKITGGSNSGASHWGKPVSGWFLSALTLASLLGFC